MSLKCGIIGLSNVGKSTIFNCISRTKAEVGQFGGVNKVNLGVADVQDARLNAISNLVKPAKITHATVEVADIPGLSKGAIRGESPASRFLGDIQQTDAIIHVLRCFDDPNIPHIEGSVDPVRDLETVELELQVKDLDIVDRKLHRMEKLAKTGEKDAKHSVDVLIKIKSQLENFQNARDIEFTDEEKLLLDDLFLFSIKPVLFVCNVDDNSAVAGNKYVENVNEYLKGKSSELIVIAGKLESEIASMDLEEERNLFIQDFGLAEPSVNKLTRAAYHLLDLQSFFTSGPKEVRAWTIHKGMNAQQSAGAIHSDLERGFIRAELMKYNDFISLGSEHAVKEAGKMKVVGKTHIIEDGDILYIRFNV